MKNSTRNFIGTFLFKNTRKKNIFIRCEANGKFDRT